MQGFIITRVKLEVSFETIHIIIVPWLYPEIHTRPSFQTSCSALSLLLYCVLQSDRYGIVIDFFYVGTFLQLRASLPLEGIFQTFPFEMINNKQRMMVLNFLIPDFVFSCLC